MQWYCYQKEYSGRINLIVGEEQVSVLAYGSKFTLSIADVCTDFQYFKRRHEAWCMENPVYDLLVGNVPGVKSTDEIDENWQANAVGTRQQKINKGKPHSALKVSTLLQIR